MNRNYVRNTEACLNNYLTAQTLFQQIHHFQQLRMSSHTNTRLNNHLGHKHLQMYVFGKYLMSNLSISIKKIPLRSLLVSCRHATDCEHGGDMTCVGRVDCQVSSATVSQVSSATVCHPDTI
jgi:hypothetical protein